MLKKISSLLPLGLMLLSSFSFASTHDVSNSAAQLMQSRAEYLVFTKQCNQKYLDGLDVDYLYGPRDYTLLYVNSALLNRGAKFTGNNASYLKSKKVDVSKLAESISALGEIGDYQDIYRSAILNVNFKVSDLGISQYRDSYNYAKKILNNDQDCAAIAEKIKNLDWVAKKIGYK